MYKVGDEVCVCVKILEHDEIYNDYKVEFKNGAFGRYDDSFLTDVCGKSYVDGLNDAWELAKKILEMCGEKLEEILGLGSYTNILEFVKPEEALAKIEAYEKEKEIKVGDVVRYGIGEDIGKYAIVMRIEGNEFYTMYADGSCGRETHTEDFKKTGKHIDIESLLKEIGE